MSRITPPFEFFTDSQGKALENGSIFIGTAGLDPVSNQIPVYWDALFTQVASQPLTTSSGHILNNGSPADVFVDDNNYSILVRDKNGRTVKSELTSGYIAEKRFEDLADLIGFENAEDGSVVIVGGTRGLGDTFQWVESTNKNTADEGSIIDPSVPLGSQGTGVGTGCWVRRYNGAMNVKWFGAIGDWNDGAGTGTDDTTAFEDAVAAACLVGHDLYIPDGDYKLAPSASIEVTEGIKIYGDGTELTRLYHKNNIVCFLFKVASSPTFRVPGPHVSLEDMACIAGGNTATSYFVQVNWSYGTVFRNILFQNPYDPNFSFIYMYNEGGNWIEGTLFDHIVFEGPGVTFATDASTASESYSRTAFKHCFFGLGVDQIGIRVENKARLYDCYFQLHYILEETASLLNVTDDAKVEQSWFTAQGEVGTTAIGVPFLFKRSLNGTIELTGASNPVGTQSSPGCLLTQAINPSLTDSAIPYTNSTTTTVDVAYYNGGNAESTPSYGRADGGSVASPIIKYWEQGGRNGLLLLKHPTGSSPVIEWLIGENGKVEYYGSEDEITFNRRLLARGNYGSLLKLVRPTNAVTSGLDCDFVFYDSNNAEKVYVRMLPEIVTNTAGSEDGKMKIQIIRAGTLTTVIEMFNSGNIQVAATYNNTTASAANMYIDSAGLHYRSTSAAKYKDNIESVESSYANAFIDNANPVYYKSKCEKDNADWSHWGFIAEELETIDPRLVHYSKEGEAEGVQYERIPVLLTKIIQEQKQQIADLTARVEALENA